MKTTAISLVIVLTFAISVSVSAQNAGGTFIPTTSVYAGDLTTEKYQEKINVIDAEIAKLEAKRAAELETLTDEYKDNMPKAPKSSKKTKTVTVENPKGKKTLAELYAEDDTTTVTKTVTTTEDPANDYAETKAAYDADYKASKEAINAKYDALIDKLNEQRLAVTEAMVNSNGNYVASTTSASGAANLYTSIKYADNIGKTNTSGTVTSTQPGQTIVMLYAYNSSQSTVVITSAPFNANGSGLTLAPGEKSVIKYAISTGIYSLTYTEYRSNSGVTRSVSKNIPISANGGNAVIIYDK